MKNEKLKDQLISAALTFASTFGVEIMIAMNGAATWTDVGWKPLILAASFTAVRAALKAVVKA